VNVHYISVRLHPFYRDRFGFKGGEFPVAGNAYERLISLPMVHTMTEQDVENVICAVGKVIGHFTK
jgi:dTDP-4-amino-4,6-dideoxygalactose transaminase